MLATAKMRFVRVLIASSPHRDTFGYSMPPPGLLRLGGALEARGQTVGLDDLAYRLGTGAIQGAADLCASSAQYLLQRIQAERIEVLGISVMGATLPAALAILQRVRAQAPQIRTLLGGPGTTGIDSQLLERFACVDVVVRGEAEQSLPALLERWDAHQTLEGLAGITHRTTRGPIQREADAPALSDLGLLPDYAWHLLPSIEAYKQITGAEDGLVPLDSGRGCVYDCSFCTIGRYWGRRSRVLPAERLAQEILALRSMPGARQAYLCHDLFAANRNHALELCAHLQRLGRPLPWEVRARADHLDAELLQAMGQAGCYRVLLGIESADPSVRKRNQKGMREDIDLLRVVDDCQRAGIVPILSLILGLPGETEHGLRQSLDFCAQAAQRTGVQLSLHLVNPQPGCGLGEEFGPQSRPIEGIPPDMALGAGESLEELDLIQRHPDLFSTWSLLPQDQAHLRRLHQMAQELPEVLMRYPRTWQRLGQALGMRDTLDLWEAWKRWGRSFEAFVLGQSDAWLQATLSWEQALVRSAARGPSALAERLSLGSDPTQAQRNTEPVVLAIHALEGKVSTSKLSADLVRVLEAHEAGALELPDAIRARLAQLHLLR